MLTTLSKNEKIHQIIGPEGELELAIFVHKENPKGPWGIVCHPHPLHGGTMYNKVVSTLIKSFQAKGVNTIRFNFRGVGRSIGAYAQGEGELDDLIAVINWVQETYHCYDLWLAGFSFGAFIAAKAANKIPVNKLVLIAPPVEHFNMSYLSTFTIAPIVIQGDKDDVVQPQAVLDWAKKIKPKAIILRFAKAGHFFHGELQHLSQELIKNL